MAASTVGFGTRGAAAAFVTGTASAYGTGFGASTVGQYFDNGQVSFGKSNIGGMAGSLGYALSGAGVVDAVLGYSGLTMSGASGAVYDITMGLNAGIVSFGAEKVMGSGGSSSGSNNQFK